MRAALLVALSASFVCAAAHAETQPSSYYNLRDNQAGTSSNGSTAGTHQIAGSGGTIGATIAGGLDPSIEIKGSAAAGGQANLYASASYSYHLTLSGANEALYEASYSQGVSDIVGYLSGNIEVSRTADDSIQVQLGVGGYHGSSSISAACVGYICNSYGATNNSQIPGFSVGTLVPFKLAVRLNDFDFGCAKNIYTGEIEGDCTATSTTVSLQASATVRSGSVDGIVDPVFNLDSAFLQKYGFDANSLTVSQDSLQDAQSPAPEPASWAMMLVGFAMVGSVQRRSYSSGRLSRS